MRRFAMARERSGPPLLRRLARPRPGTTFAGCPGAALGIDNPHMDSRPFSKELKKGSADLLILALVEARPRHGYEIGRLIEERSQGALSYHIASLYPTLYRLEDDGLVVGRWVEKPGQRRRRYYRITAAGREKLASERSVWQNFFLALDRVAGLKRS
jgi:PadR family transcriptional regulator, regulatory protein PadR